MTYTYDAVVAGHLCLDIIPEPASIPAGDFMQLLALGRLVEVGQACLITDSPVSNTGLALHKLDIVTRLLGKVGADLFGQAVGQIVASCDPGHRR